MESACAWQGSRESPVWWGAEAEGQGDYTDMPFVRDRCWARHEAAVHQKAEPLERLNSNKFFDLSSVPVAMSVDLADVEAISRVRADVDGDRLTLESGFSLWIKTISCKGRIAYQRVRCDLNELGFQVRATRTGLIVGRV